MEPSSAAGSAEPYDLERFVRAQNEIYIQVLAELREGWKRSHWMWFIFPQSEGLGYSLMSRTYAIHSTKEAQAYLNHPVLGPRLVECCRLVLGIEGRTLREIFGTPDDLKFRSSMTLFAQADPKNEVFREALAKYPAGAERD
jgi:uncharacterized protein (DUF1810 family)